MLPDDLRTVDERALLELCAQAWPESQVLDFKRDLPGRDNKARVEFLKDVCALSNADGGDLVYGVAEKSGSASSLAPITGEPADAACRRLAQILEAGIEPRATGVQFHAAPLSTGYALVIRVPSSFNGPHRYLSDGYSRFVVRVGTHTVELSYEQLRSAFDRTSSLIDRARQFRDGRIGRIISGTAWRPIAPGPLCAVHLIPIASMAGKIAVDVTMLNRSFVPFIFPDWGGASRSLNLDGLVVHHGGVPQPGEPVRAFTQIFRSGAFEAVRTAGFTIEDRRGIPSGPVAAFIRDAFKIFLEASVRYGASGPAVLSTALLRIGEHPFANADEYSISAEITSDRPDLILPEIWIERVEAPGDLDTLARQALDVLWQAFGIEHCGLFDAEGKWRGN